MADVKDLYNIGGAYYYDQGGAQRASADDQSAYLINQARGDTNNKSLADMGYANDKGGWAGTNTTSEAYRYAQANPDPYADYADDVLGLPVQYTGTDNNKNPYVRFGNKDYYNPNSWSQKDAILKAMGYVDPGDSAQDYQEELTWAKALGQAGDRINPVYDALRDRENAQAAANREMIAQVMAARYGMGGTRGGRIASQMTKSQQAEGMAVNQIEGERQRGIADLADQLMQREQQRLRDQEALRLQENQNALGWANLAANQAENAAQRKMQYDFRYLDDQQWEQQYGLSKDQFAYQQASGDREYQLAADQFAWEKDPSNLDNVMKQTQINKLLAAGTGSGGGSGTSGSELNYNTALIRASELARADPRLADGEMNMADSVNYFTLPQLVDAYMTMLAYQQG